MTKALDFFLSDFIFGMLFRFSREGVLFVVVYAINLVSAVDCSTPILLKPVLFNGAAYTLREPCVDGHESATVPFRSEINFIDMFYDSSRCCCDNRNNMAQMHWNGWFACFIM